MALSDKNILITPNRSQTADPKIEFVGASSTLGPQTITLRVYPTSNGTVSLEGSAGQLFSVTNTLTGTIYSVNDVSGIPSIEVLDTGLVKFAQYSGNVLIGTGTDTGEAKLQVTGGGFFTGSIGNSRTAKGVYVGLSLGGDPQIQLQGNGATSPHIDFDNGTGDFDMRIILTGDDTLNITGGSLTVETNTVLHAGNYNSYSPTLTGGNASGTWTINITGNAATINSQANSATITASTGVNANDIVRRDGSGYIYANHVNFNTGVENPAIANLITDNGDGWSRKSSLDHVKNSIRGVADGTWSINITGNSGTTSQREFSGDISSGGQGRFTGWYTGNAGSGTAAEIGMSSGEGYVFVYNRANGIYGTLNIAASGANMKFSGSTINVNSGALQQGGNQVLHASNYSSYALPLSGGTMTGSIAMGGYNVTGAGLFGLSNGFQIQQGGSNYGQFNSWVYLNGHYGFYASINSAHIYPNNGAYGSWRMDGSRNGWNGIYFGASNGAVSLMIDSNSNTSGFYNDAYGWQFRWAGGTAYVNKNSYGGGGEATVLDSSNYNSYSPTLTGGGASGTWGINITGSATYLTSSNYINRTGSSGNLNTDFQNTPAGSQRYHGDDAGLTNSPGGSWWIYEHKRHSNGSNYWGTQVAWGWEDNANRLAQRNVSGNSWSGWVYYLNSGNYNSYSPTLTGGGASGTWGINITGNAATATSAGTATSATSASNAAYATTAGSVSSVAASAITGQTGMWVSANRPGPYRLYRRDDDSNYSVQTYWTGSAWRLYGYNGDTGHADTHVGYADSSGYAASAGSAGTAGYATDTSKVPLTGGTMTGTLFINSKLRVNTASGPSDNAYGTATDIPMYMSGSTRTQSTFLIENNVNSSIEYPIIVIRRTLTPVGSRFGGMIRFADKNSSGTEISSQIYSFNRLTSQDLFLDAGSGTNDRVVLRAGSSSSMQVAETFIMNVKAVIYTYSGFTSSLDIDCREGNYFTRTISSDSTFTFSNVPAASGFNVAYSFTLELTHTSGTVTWPASVKWPGNTAPSLTTGKTHLFMFVTDDAGSRWRGSYLTNYDN